VSSRRHSASRQASCSSSAGLMRETYEPAGADWGGELSRVFSPEGRLMDWRAMGMKTTRCVGLAGERAREPAWACPRAASVCERSVAPAMGRIRSPVPKAGRDHRLPDGTEIGLVRANSSKETVGDAETAAVHCLSNLPALPARPGKRTKQQPWRNVTRRQPSATHCGRYPSPRDESRPAASADRRRALARTSEPEVDQQRENEADQQARGEREMKREILSSPGKITGKASQPEPLSQVEQRSDQKQRAPGEHQELCQADHVRRSITKARGRVRRRIEAPRSIEAPCDRIRDGQGYRGIQPIAQATP
jgi:hypothetical protein